MERTINPLKLSFMRYLDALNSAGISISIFVYHMPHCNPIRAEAMEDGSGKASDGSKLWVNVQWIEVST